MYSIFKVVTVNKLVIHHQNLNLYDLYPYPQSMVI